MMAAQEEKLSSQFGAKLPLFGHQECSSSRGNWRSFIDNTCCMLVLFGRFGDLNLDLGIR
jgi:hypothetical protein